ncbi:hypothetical protein ND748_23310 [Frankia sp. AiPs1]|uniref:hypothetical protein n=1 Tax=Frankia sp. AiPs1 TaxID=573493 RepID=UPI002042D8A5|nr:hypothetical protein [Frankia sp. AiPs1]MCM3924580.1 hypothetical protein [Frankia sp. AiPs1]
MHDRSSHLEDPPLGKPGTTLSHHVVRHLTSEPQQHQVTTRHLVLRAQTAHVDQRPDIARIPRPGRRHLSPGRQNLHLRGRLTGSGENPLQPGRERRQVGNIIRLDHEHPTRRRPGSPVRRRTPGNPHDPHGSKRLDLGNQRAEDTVPVPSPDLNSLDLTCSGLTCSGLTSCGLTSCGRRRCARALRGEHEAVRQRMRRRTHRGPHQVDVLPSAAGPVIQLLEQDNVLGVQSKIGGDRGMHDRGRHIVVTPVGQPPTSLGKQLVGNQPGQTQQHPVTPRAKKIIPRLALGPRHRLSHRRRPRPPVLPRDRARHD